MQQPGGGAHIINTAQRVTSVEQRIRDRKVRDLFAKGASDREIASAIGLSTRSIPRLRQDLGLNRFELSDRVPADLAERASTMTLIQLRRHYKVSYERLVRWFERGGIERQAVEVKRPVPDDFHEYAPTATNVALAERYGASVNIVARWRKESGIPTPYFKPIPPRPKKSVLKPISRGTVAFPIRADTPGPEGSMAGMAAHHLRRWFPRVFRARTVDPKADADLWIVGALTLTTDQLLQKAEAKGWRAAA